LQSEATCCPDYASRDERGKSWIPKFGSFPKDTIQQAGTNDAVRISEDKDVITMAYSSLGAALLLRYVGIMGIPLSDVGDKG